MAVYDAPQSAEEPQPRTQGKASKKSGKAAAAASAASAASSSDATATAASSSSAPLVRYLYYKSHSAAAGADDGLKAGCTLFVVNIPFHYTAEHLTQLFACFGSVEQVSFLQSHLSLRFDPAFTGAVEPSSFYRSAHVVYEQEESHDMAIKTDLAKTPQQCPEEAEDDANVGMRSQFASSTRRFAR